MFITVTKENITITLPSLANTSKGTAINIYTTFTTQGSVSITSNSNALNGPDGTGVRDISIRKQESLLLNYNGASWDVAILNKENISSDGNGSTEVQVVSGRNRMNDFFWGGERK